MLFPYLIALYWAGSCILALIRLIMVGSGRLTARISFMRASYRYRGKVCLFLSALATSFPVSVSSFAEPCRPWLIDFLMSSTAVSCLLLCRLRKLLFGHPPRMCVTSPMLGVDSCSSCWHTLHWGLSRIPYWYFSVISVPASHLTIPSSGYANGFQCVLYTLLMHPVEDGYM